MKNYYKDGILINLDIEYIPYQKLIYDPDKYLNRNTKYYIYCKKGVKSKYVYDALKDAGFTVSRLI